MKSTAVEALAIRARAELLLSQEDIAAAVQRIAREITVTLEGQQPLVLAVMRGGVVFAGHLLPLLPFPLDFDYVDASRYGTAVRGSDLNWRVDVPAMAHGRVVLVVDDILDEGHTLAAIKERLFVAGAAQVLLAVFADKQLEQAKPVTADFVAVTVPDRFVFGFGMDVRGMWRNLPAVYALSWDEPE